MLKECEINQLCFTYMLHRVVHALELDSYLTSATCQLQDPE